MIGGHGIADGITGRRMRSADSPGQRVEPEHERCDVQRQIPRKIMAPVMG
jgi:hypothetical protein